MNRLTEENIDLQEYFNNAITAQLFVDSNLILRKFTNQAKEQFPLTINDLGQSMFDVKNHFRFPSIVENVRLEIK